MLGKPIAQVVYLRQIDQPVLPQHNQQAAGGRAALLQDCGNLLLRDLQIVAEKMSHLVEVSIHRSWVRVVGHQGGYGDPI